MPIDPTHPVARRRELCERSGLDVIVGLPEATRPLSAQARTLDPFAVAPGPVPDPCVAPTAGDPAYILFTSGSSGRPKGVRVLHRGVTNLLGWVRSTLGDDLARAAAGTSFGFDPSIIELFGPLVTGGAVRLLANALALGDLDEPVTFAAMPPSVVAELRRAGRFPSLATLVVGGEVLPSTLADDLLASGSVRRLINTYGPTEATVMVTAHDVVAPTVEPVPIGREIPGALVRLLDAHREPVAPGVVGEIWLGGAQVADGYVGDAELTSAQFVDLDGGVADAPTNLTEDWPWYRTGDLAVRRADGTLEFRGRLDQQLKVRGFRVEPAEIEAALHALPGVAQAAVVAVGGDLHRQLVAYLVPRGAGLDGRDVAAALRRTLPGHLVPTGFVNVDRLPLGPTGKVDRRALPEWAGADRTAPTAARSPVDRSAPASPAEEIVSRIVAEVLDLTGPIGPEDDFVDDLNGSSLAMVELLCRLEQAFDCRLELGRVVSDTTIAGFAALAERRAADRSGVVTMHPDGTREPLFLIHAYLGSMLLYRRLAPHVPADQPMIGVHARDLDDEAVAQSSIDQLARRAVEVITSMHPCGPYQLGGHSIGGLIAYEAARQLTAAGEEVSSLVLIDAPSRRSLAQYYWGELVVNWPELRGRRPAELRTRAGSMISSRLSPYRRPEGPNRVDVAVAQAGRANNLAVRGHRSRPYCGDVVVLHTRQGVQMALGNPTLGWDRLVDGEVRTCGLPGEHNTVFDPPHVGVLGAELVRALRPSEESVPT